MKYNIITLGLIVAIIAFASVSRCHAQATKTEAKNDSVAKPNKLQLELMVELSNKIQQLQQEFEKNKYLIIGYKREELDGEPVWDGEKFIFKLKTKNK